MTAWNFGATVAPDNYDANTFNVVLDVGFGVTLAKSVRIHGVDPAAIKGRTAETRAFARYARDEAQAFLLRAKHVVFQSTVWKGYHARPVGDLIADDKSLAEWLVEMKFAVPHDGDDSRDARDARRAQHQANALEALAAGRIEV